MTFTTLPLPEIETDRLILRGWLESDYDCLLEIFGNEETARYIGGVKPDWQTWRHMALIYGHWHLRGYTVFVVECKEDHKPIGYAGPWCPIGWPEPEIGYSLISSAQGKGFATEAALATLRYAYDTLGWKTAISLIDVNNAGSKAVAKKMGARFECEAILFDAHPAEKWRHLSPTELEL